MIYSGMRESRKLSLGVVFAALTFCVGDYVFLTHYFGIPAFNDASSPISIFLIFLFIDVAYAVIVMLLLIGMNSKFQSEARSGIKYYRPFSLAINIFVLSIIDISLALEGQTYTFWQSTTPFSNITMLFLWGAVTSAITILTIFWIMPERKGARKTTPSTRARHQKALVVCTLCAVLLSGAFSTYLAFPQLEHQQVVPDHGSVYFETVGGFADSFFNVVKGGTVNGSLSSSTDFTLYVLNYTQFAALVAKNPVGAPPLSANFTLSDYTFSSGSVRSVNFTTSLSPGFYAFVYFNRGGYGTLININWLIFSPSDSPA